MGWATAFLVLAVAHAQQGRTLLCSLYAEVQDSSHLNLPTTKRQQHESF